MRSIRHWSPRYILNRIRLAVNERLDPQAPWLTASMVVILSSWLKETDVGLEFGSGRSTAWFAQRISRLISVEHDARWHKLVSERLRAAALASRVDYRFASADDLEMNYLSIFNQIKEASLDFALIDGVYRDECATRVIPKLKPGGIVIVDNANWYLPPRICSHSPATRAKSEGGASPLWNIFAETTSSWRCVWTSNGVTDTAFWSKPFE